MNDDPKDPILPTEGPDLPGTDTAPITSDAGNDRDTEDNNASDEGQEVKLPSTPIPDETVGG